MRANRRALRQGHLQIEKHIEVLEGRGRHAGSLRAALWVYLGQLRTRVTFGFSVCPA